MSNTDIWKLIKKLADRMSMDTVKTLLEADMTFKKKKEQCEEAERLLDSLSLTDTESQITNAFRNCIGELENERAIIFYIAGIIDTLNFMNVFQLIEM